MKNYFVYILKCSDNSYYTGITNNLERRVSEHNLGEISSYTSIRRPVTLFYADRFTNVNDAISAEKQIKGWSRIKKEALAKGDYGLLKNLSKSHPSTGSG